MVDDENCRSNESLQDKVTYFICNECGGHELGRVVGGDRRYALSLVKRDLWRHIKEGTFNEVSTATKEALTIYQEIEASKKSESDVSTPVEPSIASTQEVIVIDEEKATECESEEALHVKSEEVHNELNEEVKKDGI